MQKFRFATALASFFVFACFAGGQSLVAQEKAQPRVRVRAAPRESAETRTTDNRVGRPENANAPAPTLNLYSLQAAFTQTYPIIGANADGTDIWPCTGDSSGTGPDPDCPTIGDPSITFPSNATAIGNPAFIWQLKNVAGSGNGYGCDALINGTGHLGVPYLPCGQAETWYEDNTNDTTDDLLYSMVVTQGANTISDTGMVDIGPNIYGGTTPASDVIIYNPTNFGYGPGDGPSTGPNNGDCNPDYNYPLTAPANPGGEYLVAAGKTCVRPTAGWATVTVTTALGAPIYKEVKGAACAANGVASPCYTVEWIKKYELCQKWDIFLE